jgi:preprotein translocase subunit SecY
MEIFNNWIVQFFLLFLGLLFIYFIIIVVIILKQKIPIKYLWETDENYEISDAEEKYINISNIEASQIGFIAASEILTTTSEKNVTQYYLSPDSTILLTVCRYKYKKRILRTKMFITFFEDMTEIIVAKGNTLTPAFSKPFWYTSKYFSKDI